MRSLLAFLALVGCNDSQVDTASCSSCGSGSYSTDDCERFAHAAGCSHWSLAEPSGAGCGTGCSFSYCDSLPDCSPPARDAGQDAPLDPRCAGEDGLFANCDLCPDDCHDVNINGATQHTCGCGSCPCGFVCGSIPLDVGGTLGSVCAPQE